MLKCCLEIYNNPYTSDFKVTERSAAVALTMAGSNDKNPMTR